jgi:hypothetical protein
VSDRLVRHVAHVPAVKHETIDDLEDPAHVPHRDHVRDLELDLATGRAQEGAHRGLGRPLPAEHRCLVQQRERIARRAFGSARDRVGRRGIQRDAFGRRDRLDHLGEPFDRESPEVEPLARPTIVAGILCGSVVASTNRTPTGGSSNTFSSASNASRDSRCASSMM